MIATHAGAVAGAWIYYLAIEVCGTTDPDADDAYYTDGELCDHDAEIEPVTIEIEKSIFCQMFQLFQINWPPEDYDPEDDEIAKVYTNGGKVSCHHHDHHQHRHRYGQS